MTDYRIYQVDKNGHVQGPPFIVNCEDDETAIAKAKQYVDGLAIEVGDGGCRVAHLPSID